jgi:hypothetical protein
MVLFPVVSISVVWVIILVIKFDIDRAACNSPSLTLGLPSAIDLALAFNGGGYFDYMGTY